MTAKTATPTQYAGDMLEKALSDRARLIMCVRDLLNSNVPHGVAEDAARSLLRELEDGK